MKGRKVGSTKAATWKRNGMLIRAYNRNNATVKQLAEAFNISENMVYYVLRKYKGVNNG